MAEQSGFFDARLVDGFYDRVYVSEFFAAYFASFIGNGVYHHGEQLVVTQTTEPSMNVRVAPGQGWINGYWYRNDDELVLEIGESSDTYGRKDIVVLQLNLQNREMKIIVKQGTPAATPLEPELVRTDDVYELKLAVVSVLNGSIYILDENIQDTRLDSDVCGFVTAVVDQLDSATFALELRNYIDNLEENSDAEVQALIDELNAMIDSGDVSQIYRRLVDLENFMNVTYPSDKQQMTQQMQQIANQVANEKLSKPANEEGHGLLYYDVDSDTVILGKVSDWPPVDASEFLYSIVIDNGADGTPKSYEYLNDCAGFTPASGSNLNSWAGSKLLDCFKPCLISPTSKTPYKFLQKNNMTLFEDGTSAATDIASGNYDVMIQVGKLYGKVSEPSTNKLQIDVSSVPIDGGFCFTEVGGVEYDYVYRGAYKATGSSSAMTSVSGKSPYVNMTRAVARTAAKNRVGSAYGQSFQNSLRLMNVWQMMYLLLYASRDSQTALGAGFTGGSAAQTTGRLNTKPFCYGGSDGVKFLGCEDFYGNVFEWVDGLVVTQAASNTTYNVSNTPNNFADTAMTGGTSFSVGSKLASNYIVSMLANGNYFLPKSTSGSSSTYYCDYSYYSTTAATYVTSFGGGWNGGAYAGAFSWGLDTSASSAGSRIGSRLCRV